MVGDTLDVSIQGAGRAGMPSVWLRSREDARQEGSSNRSHAQTPAVPDATIAQLDELSACLLTL